MKVFVTAAAMVLLSVGVAAAQTTSNSQSGSQSVSGVVIEGSQVPNNTPNASMAVGSAGNCYPGAGIGASGPGWGLTIGGGRVDGECNTRAEMAALAQLAGNRAALAHACRHDASMRETLVGLGICRVQNTARTGNSGDTIDDETVRTVNRAYTFCGKDQSGRLIVRVPARTSQQQRSIASAQCGQDYAANGGVNIGR